MKGYWIRHRLVYTVVLSVAVALIASVLFVFPYISQQANRYNSQSVYKNTMIDFLVPEPSFEQVESLPGTNGINKIFPFYMTKTQVNVNGKLHTSTVLLSDQMKNIDITMYNADRLIEKSDVLFENPILVDWQFCHDTSAKIGDVVSVTIAGNSVEYTIYAIYETNTLYDGGALLIEINEEQSTAINSNSKNSGYSGMYVSASEYEVCRIYLNSEYKPLGRLKNPEVFESDAQYQVHYNAIMDAAYANEITDFRMKESGLKEAESPLMLIIGAVLVSVLILAFNVLMNRRGCENGYFTKHCLQKGWNIKPYYVISFVAEIVLLLSMMVGVLIFEINYAEEYISTASFGSILILIPMAIIIAEIISLALNYLMVTKMIVKEREKLQRKNKMND